MKTFLVSILSFFLFLNCSENKVRQASNDSLVGEWRLKEQFISPGGGGEWRPVPDADQCIITFRDNGVFSYTPNFVKAAASFDRYVKEDNKIIMSSTANSNTETWDIQLLNKQTLELSVVLCVEGCPYRFMAIK